MSMNMIENPVIRGFHPDPSVCRAGEDFYLVNSTFEYFPGIPIYHSRNLANWELSGYAMTKEEELELRCCHYSDGLYAPTLRYHNGTFFILCTNVSGLGNFIIHSNDIGGPWSAPVRIEHDGIDPSIFWDDDDKAYFTGTATDENGTDCIVLFQMDPFTGAVLSEKKIISYGITGHNPEGPHLYKRNGWYYLILAEGGTEYLHQVTMFRAAQIEGPYEGCPFNPILTNQNYRSCAIRATGHADIVETADGQWWMVCLGIRKLPRLTQHNLGRETCLVPVKWDDDGWLWAGNQGHVEEHFEADLPGNEPYRMDAEIFHDCFGGTKMSPEWMYLRRYPKTRLILENGLKMMGTGASLSDLLPVFAGIRQTEFHQSFETMVILQEGEEGCRAGITAYYCCDNHYDLYVVKHKNRFYVELNKRIYDMESVVKKSRALRQQQVQLKITADTEYYHFYYKEPEETEYHSLGKGSVSALTTEATRYMSFTGTFWGLYAYRGTAVFSYAQRENEPSQATVS